MFLVKRQRSLNEANEKALSPICTVQVQKIFALLHAQAVQAAEKAGVIIENTAADGNDAKTAVFHSAGEHMIVARLKDGKIDKKAALTGIKAYVKVFCGEDVSNGLKEDECFPLQNDSIDTAGDEDLAESIPSFSVFLSESTGVSVIAEADNQEADAVDDEESEDSAESEEDSDEMDDEEDGDDASSEEDGDDASSEEDGDDASSEEDGDGNDKEGLADGYYVLYGLKIKGLKETTVSDALKQWGSNFLKGFGVTIDSLWGPGGSGEVHTIGGLVKGVKGLFGAIDDPDELVDRIDKAIKQKYPSLQRQTIEFRDKKTLVNDLDITKRSGYDGKVRQKIMSADYSLYVKVEENDPLQPILNRKALANIVTMQIKGLFKKFKNIVKADDIIYLKGAALQKANPEALHKLEDNIPTYDQVEKIVMNDKSTFQDVFVAIEKMFDEKINKNPIHKESQKCKNALQPWESLKKKYPTSGDMVKGLGIEDTGIQKKKESKSKAFGKFLSDYKDMFDNDFDDAEEETVDEYENMFTAYDMLTEMFGDSRWNDKAIAIFEDGNGNDGQSNTATEQQPEENSAENQQSQAEQGGSPSDEESVQDDNDSDEGNENDEHGDDLYLIPMQGVTYEKSDDKDDIKGV